MKILGLSGALNHDPSAALLVDGEIVAARCGAKRDADAVYEFVGWEKGRFRFSPGDAGPGAPLEPGFEGLLLEACRRLDEGRPDTDAAR